MKTLTSLFASLAIIGFTATTWADPLPPKTKKPQPRSRPAPSRNAVPLVIELDANAAEARLQIPRKWLGTTKPTLVAEGVPAAGGLARNPTIVAGAALTVALVSAGFWFARGKGRPAGHLAAGLLVIGGLAGVSGAVVWASGRDPVDPPKNRQPPPLATLAKDKVRIQVLDKGDTVKLVVHPNLLRKIGVSPERLPRAGKPGPGPKPAPGGKTATPRTRPNK